MFNRHKYFQYSNNIEIDFIYSLKLLRFTKEELVVQDSNGLKKLSYFCATFKGQFFWNKKRNIKYKI